MKIVRIFADQLFAFHYDGKADNEYDRCMELWTDINYLQKYAKSNGVANVTEFVNEVLNDAEQIQDFLENISQNKESFGFYFQPLQESERNTIRSFQKGKIKRNRLSSA